MVGRAPAEMISEGDVLHKFRREKAHISPESGCVCPNRLVAAINSGLGGLRRGDGPSSSSDMADFSVEGEGGGDGCHWGEI